MAQNPAEDLSQIQHEYPLPIAHEYGELLQIEEVNWQARNLQLFHLAEYAIRYCTIIALSEYHLRTADLPASATDKFILNQLASPKVKACVGILAEVVRDLRFKGELFMPELQDFCIDNTGALTRDWYLMESLSGLDERVALRSPADERPNRELYQESFGPVMDLLRRLAFLKKYTLVRLIASVGNEKDWTVNELMGSEIFPRKTADIVLETGLAPQTLGLWSRQTKKFLQLSPYALFQYCGECFKRDSYRDNDFFLYERRDAGKSIFTGLQDTRGSHHHISLDDFVEQQVRRQERQEIVAVQTWSDIGREMGERTADQLRHLNEKFDRATYTRREALGNSFLGFVNSLASGFLVVGDSGIGKTNQLCYLAGEYSEKGEIVILENCAAWDASAAANLDQYLSTRYRFAISNSWVKALSSLHARHPEHPRLILFLDAINEYADPQRLLDALYNQVLIPLRGEVWFRLVISCRTETWKRLEGSFQAERLFFASPDGSVVHWLRRFEADEIPKAYQAYQKRYQLQTSYDELSGQVRNFIAYPLMLRLVAESSRGQPIPPTLRSQHVFKKYVELKIGDPNPGLADLDRKEKRITDRIIELMIEHTQDYLDKAQLFNDESIGQLVYDGSIGSAYVRLLDKGVLLEVGEQSGPKSVRFTYDQILEYLLARHLLPEDLEAQSIVGLIRQSLAFPSLWGAVRMSLLMRQSEDAVRHLTDDGILVDLAYRAEYGNEQGEKDQVTLTQVRAMMVDTLTTWAMESSLGKQQVSDFASGLLASNQESPGLMAVEVVHQLGLYRLLETAACSPVAYVRQLATLYIFFLFQQGDGQEGIDSFRNIRQTVKHQISLRGIAGVATRLNKGMDSIRGLRALLDLVLLSIPLGYRYPAVIRPVGDMLVEFLNGMPAIIQSAIGSFLASYGVDLIISIITTSNQLAKMRPFFDLPVGDPFRTKVANLIDYFDPSAGSLDGELGDLIFDVGHTTDMFAYLMIVQVLMTRVGPQFDSLYRFCRRMYTAGNDHCKHIALRVFTLINHIERKGAYWRPEHEAFARQMTLELAVFGVRYSWKRERTGPVTLLPVGPLDEFEGICHTAYVLLGELEDRTAGALEIILQVRALTWHLPESKRTAAIMYALYDGTKIGVATTRLNILPVLETIQMYFDVTDPDEQEAVADGLLRLRTFFPAEVDRYLTDAPRWLRLRVLSDFRPTPLGSVSNSGMQWGVPWLFLTTPIFRQTLTEVLARAAQSSKDIDSDIPGFARRILNIPMLKAVSQAMANAGQVNSPR